MLKKTFCAFLLLWLVLTGAPQVTESVDFVASNSNSLTRVVSYVEITYPLALVRTTTYTKFPDFSIRIDLPFSQFVTVKYNIQMDTPSTGYLYTVLRVDDKEIREFTVTSGYFHHQSNQSYGSIWLQKGKHLLEVWYITNTGFDSLQMVGWSVAMFKVEYYKQSA